MQVFCPVCGCRWRWGGAGQNRFGTEARGRFCCCICAAGFQLFSLSAVGVVALAPATAVQLDVGACCLAVASGAEGAAPCMCFGSLHPVLLESGFDCGDARSRSIFASEMIVLATSL